MITLAKGPNTVKFMNRMIEEYRTGKLNDKQVCASIRRITNLNEKQCAYCNTRIALKMYNKMPMDYLCMEPCDPSAEEVLIDSDHERYQQWIVNIRCDILAGKYGKDIRQYMEDVWLHRRKLFKRL